MRPTMLQAEQAAELLGIDVYTLAFNLRHAAADELEALARRVRQNDDEPINVARARRLKAAADAALAVWDANVAVRATPGDTT